MPILIVNPGSPNAWEIQLVEGTHRVGRNPDNDVQVNDPSVSGLHCQIVVGADSVVIADLGSTNGTFINGAQIREAELEAGQSVHMGSVEMVFYSELPQAPATAPLRPASQPGAVSATVPPMAHPRATSRLETTRARGSAPAGPRFCKYHPRSPARYWCAQCSRAFCEVCVISTNAGGAVRKTCRTCGAECAPLQVQSAAGAGDRGFLGRLPNALAYPLRGAGVFVLLVGIVLFGLLRLGVFSLEYGLRGATGIFSAVRLTIFGVIVIIWAGGYLFTFLQSILHSTAAEDRELSDLPGMNLLEDILRPLLRLLGLLVFCFGPALILSFFSSRITPVPALIATVGGCVYFPMAFLAVAVLDNVASVNPLVVVPSILKAPLEYLAVLVLFAGVYFFRSAGFDAMSRFFPDGFSTPSVGALFGMLGSYAVLFFGMMYLLTVTVHVLGLIYVLKKDKLSWR
jgi:hypothetical protein